MVIDKGGIVFDIQKYSIHDGPGIRTTVFLKGCPLRCFWCQNPEAQTVTPQLYFYEEKCGKCGRCAKVCPVEASTLSNEVLSIDLDKCVGCGKCVDACLNEARKLIGEYITAAEVIREVKKDVRFYKNSGGGVTLSGGEPLFQYEFAIDILQKCKDLGLHTVLETCGLIPWMTIEKALPYVDFVLYDIKHIDADKHQRGTGKSNTLILENAKKIASFKPMLVRTPLIPGFNDSVNDIEAIAHFVKAELPLVSMELLAYNKFGEGKYKRLRRDPTPLQLQDEQFVQSLRDVMRRTLART
jgi:pyruvate formate lyase activating enzyme